ncbi:MAG: Apocarotenoid-15,15'-oxygenase [Chroococcopsis gigantea SAG 12.99]|jgi:all-trans-8'-apo-beta-carotenal 15,15'-oxygenase|nr:carotenoid oxygenase family protein [Chlorogloea purpurea SAG 13.99]MDV3000683.1 Apocarotenoid-15,15'-oxygenase [Chroococcopsis gigantea SAG 12.99]
MVASEINTGKSYDRLDWQGGYLSQPNEYNYSVENIEGEIPPELEGTLFRNGPGLLDIGGVSIRHPFDGDGMVSAITFQGGRVHYQNRFVGTEGYLQEKAEGKAMYRGVFGTQKPGGWLSNIFDTKLKNIANTNIIYWGGKLLALWEAASPYRLNPATLETIGLDDLDGILDTNEAFSAHPRIDPDPLTLVNFALKPGLSTKINLYEIDPSGKLTRRHSHTVPGFSFIHDFAITPNYAIFFQNPVSFNPFPFLLGLRGAGECVQYQPGQPTKIILIGRDGSRDSMKILETPSGFVFHHANAFETPDGKIVIDSVCYENLPQVEPEIDYKDVDFDKLSPGQLWRFRVDLTASKVERELLEGRCCEFPTLNPEKVGRDYRYLYIGAAHDQTGNAPLQAVLKIDLETGSRQLHSFAPKGYISEPLFVPRAGSHDEDDGWVLLLVYDAKYHRSDVVILDAKNIEGKPVAIVHLDHHIPYGLHGSWTPQVFL